jgi:TolB-like protein/Tfp pilus assembly protein PilF
MIRASGEHAIYAVTPSRLSLLPRAQPIARELQWLGRRIPFTSNRAWSLIGMPGRSGEDLLWLVIQAAGVGLFETISIDGERVSRQSSSRQQVDEKKVSVTSITDRFCVPANFEDLGCPPKENTMKALTREFGPRSPVSSEGSAKSFRRSSEWECRTIPTIYEFGPFRLDVQGETLFKGTEAVALSHRAVVLLRILVDHAGAPVTKDALMKAAWPGLAVEDSNLTVQIAALRRALGEVPGGESWIATLPRRGYRFAGPAVTKSEARRPATPTADAATRPASMVALVLPDKPSIAVLPFENLGGDPERGYFVDGMVEEIITALSRIRWLFVIARNSSFTYKGRAVDIKQVGRELGVLYVLEGSVRKAGNRIRISAQLLDATTGAHLWADRFDAQLADVFELQENVASSVAGVIEPRLEAAEYHRSTQRATNDLTAYDLYLRARAHTFSWEREGIMRALDLLGQALTRDPDYGLALAFAAHCRMQLSGNGWCDDQQQNRQEGVDLARRALQVAGDDPNVLGYVAHVLGHFEPDVEPAITLIDRALDLNPSFAFGWYVKGWLRLWAGQADVAIELLEKSLRLNPLRKAPAIYSIGVAHFFARRLEKAAAMLLVSLQETPNWAGCLHFLAACYAHLGRLVDAGSIVEKLRQTTPVLVPSAEQWRVREDREFFLDGLRLAVDQTARPANATPGDN